MRAKLLIFIIAFCISGYLAAEEFPANAGTAETTPAQDVEPEVTIVHRGDELIEEYRINNQLYMIKVTPKKGYSYFLVDTNGDGRLDTRRGDLSENLLIPQWTLFRWK